MTLTLKLNFITYFLLIGIFNLIFMSENKYLVSLNKIQYNFFQIQTWNGILMASK